MEEAVATAIHYIQSIPPQTLAKAPEIIGCDAWGAYKPREASPLIHPEFYVIHHMANANDPLHSVYSDAWKHGVEIVRQCQHNHMYTDYLTPGGAADTGQQLTQMRDGLLFEGRHGSKEAVLKGLPIPQGAQCEHYNPVSMGTEHEGNYHAQCPPQLLLVKTISLAAWCCFVYDIDTTSGIVGHRDKCATECPGNFFAPLLPAIRAKAHDVKVLLRQKAKRDSEGYWKV